VTLHAEQIPSAHTQQSRIRRTVRCVASGAALLPYGYVLGGKASSSERARDPIDTNCTTGAESLAESELLYDKARGESVENGRKCLSVGTPNTHGATQNVRRIAAFPLTDSQPQNSRAHAKESDGESTG
jgi:hypothetical protein